MTDAPKKMPKTIMVRDTNLQDDLGGMGQRIYTTAGAGYTKSSYTRTDIADERIAGLVAALASIALEAGKSNGTKERVLDVARKALGTKT